jgi:hypothetical protein
VTDRADELRIIKSKIESIELGNEKATAATNGLLGVLEEQRKKTECTITLARLSDISK